MIFALQRLTASGATPKEPPAGVVNFPLKSLLGPVLYLSVLGFNLTMATIIGEMTIAVTGLFIVFLPLILVLTLACRRVNRYSKDELAAHVRDIPWSAAAGRR
jgi:putative membrane protein